LPKRRLCRGTGNIVYDGGGVKILDFEAPFGKVLELRLFQNFSFWNSFPDFSGKTGFGRFSQELGTSNRRSAPTGFWNRLSCPKILGSGQQLLKKQQKAWILLKNLCFLEDL
jgi:hypothetical protein